MTVAAPDRHVRGGRRPSTAAPAAPRTTHVASTRSGVPSCQSAEAQRGPARRAGRAACRAGPPTTSTPSRRPRRRSAGHEVVLGARGPRRAVGSQPVLAMPASTRHVPPPRSTARACGRSRGAARPAPGRRRTRRAARPRRGSRSSGGFVQIAEVVPAAELDRPELRVVERVPVDVLRPGRARRPSAARRAPARRSGRGTRSRSPASSPVAAWTTSQNSVVQREHAEVLVGPVVGGAAHRVGLVPREVLVTRSAPGSRSARCRSRRAASTPTRRPAAASESAAVDDGRSSTPPLVWKAL